MNDPFAFLKIERARPKLAVAALGFAIVLHGASLWAGSGQVRDENGKPLAGVFVMAMWNASTVNPVDSRTVCYDFAITQTDREGNYSLRSFSWNFWPFYFDRQRYRDFYLAGYETLPTDTLEGAVITMRRYTGTVEQRLTKLTSAMGPQVCTPGREEKKLGPLYKAQYEEAKQIATKPAELKLVRSLKLAWLSAVLPFNDEHRNSDATLKEKYFDEVPTETPKK